MPTKMVNFTNKMISRWTKNLSKMHRVLVDLIILCAAYILSFCSHNAKKRIADLKLKTKSSQDIVINHLGLIDLKSDTKKYKKDILGIHSILADADVSFTVTGFGVRNNKAYSSLSSLMKNYRIMDVAHNNKFIKSRIYRTEAGNVAVCACMLHQAPKTKGRIRIRLVREYYLLKRMGAEYVIVYLTSKNQKATTPKDKRLCDLLLKAGVDYVVNEKSGLLDSGVTHRQKNASVSRAVYSMGTFLSGRKSFPEGRAIIRTRLRRVNGKLQAFEEAYYPLRYNKKTGLQNLIAEDAQLEKRDITVLSRVEKNLPRLRRVDKIITVGDICEVVGAELPEKYSYIRDFSIGRVSGRPFFHRPGDVYIRWQPHTDPNDAPTYKRRCKQAKYQTKLASKVDMFVVTYDSFNIKTPHVVVENSMEAHIAVGQYLRKQRDLRCVAITGSIGKTSTKDMLYEVMKLQYKTVKSEKNENIHSKISLALQRITSDAEVYIQELGGGRPGGASRHSRMVLPEATVVTNIGDAHLGNFYGDKEALMRNKLQIIDGMPEDGVIYLNGDDPLLVNAEPNCRKILYAVHNKNADYYADEVVAEGNSTRFQIVHGDHRVEACVHVPGEHNVLNAVCAFAIGVQFGIPEEVIVEGISHFKTQGIRQNVVSASGMQLFFDCFNASSGSVESSIKTLRQIEIPEHGKRIAVVGDITGLGDAAVEAHKEIAHVLIENPADVFIFYGTNTQYTYDIVKEAGFEAYYTSDYSKLCKLLEEKAAPGDAVMAKGSSKMKLEYAFDSAFGTRSFDSAMIEEGAYYRAHVGDADYNLFTTHATAVRVKEGKKTVNLSAKIGADTVHSIATGFGNPVLEVVNMPETIRHIGINAFRDSKNLKQVEGSKQLKYIGDGAFAHCVSLETMTLPKTLLHIGSNAFLGCTALKSLNIPESVAQIGADAFAGCPNLKITCKAGSYAESYLEENGIAFQYTEER